MRVSRLFTESRLEPGEQVLLDANAGHYVFRVLKLRAGNPLVLFNGDGSDYAAELLSNRRDRVELQVTARLPAVAESPLTVTLVQAVGKGDRMDLALQKSTELGVAAVQPLFTERTEVRIDGARLEKRMEHWRRVMIAACEQCGRARLPELLAPLSLPEWLALPGRPTTLALAPGAELSLATALDQRAPLALVVGPEGGLSELETKQLQLAGARLVGFGPRVLRTETAGPAAVAVLQALWGDMAG
jgi:16S rRNA (uracil1498-N3)-methyltransferase